MQEKQPQNFTSTPASTPGGNPDKKLYWVIGIVIAVVLLAAAGFFWWQAQQEAAQEKQREQSQNGATLGVWQTYQNQKLGFEMQYPKDDEQLRPLEQKEDQREFPLYGQGTVFVESAGEFKEFSLQHFPVSVAEFRQRTEQGADVYGSIQETSIGGKTAYRVVTRSMDAGNSAHNCFTEQVFVSVNTGTLNIQHKKCGQNNQGFTQAQTDAFNDILVTLRFTGSTGTSTWQTYRNDEFGFEVKYPAHFTIVAETIGEAEVDTFQLRVDAEGGNGESLRFQVNRKESGLRTWSLEDYVGYWKGEIIGHAADTIDSEVTFNTGSVQGVKLTYTPVPEGDLRTVALLEQGEYLYAVLGNSNVIDQILSTFRFVGPVESGNQTSAITVLSPNGGETLAEGATYIITWDNAPHVQWVTIELYASAFPEVDGVGVSTAFAVAGVSPLESAQRGYMRWQIPRISSAGLDLANYQYFKVAVSGYQDKSADNQPIGYVEHDVSDAAFRINFNE